MEGTCIGGAAFHRRWIAQASAGEKKGSVGFPQIFDVDLGNRDA